METWVWEAVDVDRSGSSGDVSKLFKNEGVKRPGVLGVDAPTTDATLLAREAIQNSWDAGRALADQLRAEGHEAPRFSMRFVYRRFVGDDKERIVAASGLVELAARASRCDRRQLGLAEHDCLQELDQPEEPLSVLFVEESATTGMDGPWRGAASKLYLALVSIGFTLKAEGAGGSYGYGKAGLIRTSATRTVLAHTCFREQPEDPGVTRRLLGMTYWGQHSFDDAAFTGFARLGRTVQGKVVPFENDEADQVAGQLGIRLRDPAVFRRPRQHIPPDRPDRLTRAPVSSHRCSAPRCRATVTIPGTPLVGLVDRDGTRNALASPARTPPPTAASAGLAPRGVTASARGVPPVRQGGAHEPGTGRRRRGAGPGAGRGVRRDRSARRRRHDRR